MELPDFVLKLTLSEDEVAAIPATAKDYLGQIIEQRFRQPQLPAPGESMAITVGTPKTCALFFDRVWYPPVWGDSNAGDIGAYGATEVEIWAQLALLFTYKGFDIRRAGPELLATPFAKLATSGPMERAIGEALGESRSINATPVYRSSSARDRQYGPGKTEVVVAALNSVPLAVEKGLSWEQVRETRADKRAQKQLRRLIHWLDAEMLGKSPQNMANEIDQRVEAYEWALQKHGIQTVLGSLSSMLDAKSLATTAATFATVAVARDTLWASIAAAGVFITKGVLAVATNLVERESIKRGPGAEIAFVHEILE